MLNVLLLILNLIAICSVNNAYANEEDPKIESLCKKSSVDLLLYIILMMII